MDQPKKDNMIIVEAARTVLHHSRLETRFWVETLNTVTYVLNAACTSSLKGETPFEVWFEKQPDITRLPVLVKKFSVEKKNDKSST